MIETVDTKMLKAVFEPTHILRWEDDGGAVFETLNPIPQTTNTPQSMDVAWDCFFKPTMPGENGKPDQRRT